MASHVCQHCSVILETNPTLDGMILMIHDEEEWIVDPQILVRDGADKLIASAQDFFSRCHPEHPQATRKVI